MPITKHTLVAFVLSGCVCACSTTALARPYELKLPLTYVSDTGPNGSNRLVMAYTKITIVPAGETVQINVGNIGRDYPLLPARALAAVLKRDSKSKKFRISWSAFHRGGSFISTTLYDRNKCHLKFFSLGSADYIDLPHDYRSVGQLVAVTDKQIFQLVAPGSEKLLFKRGNAPAPETAGFMSHLPKLGAQIVHSEVVSLRTAGQAITH